MGLFETIKMPTHGSFSSRLRYFPLKYIKYSCGEMPRLAKKSLATVQFANFQTAPNTIFIITQFFGLRYTFNTEIYD
jgi:hypothetical protein